MDRLLGIYAPVRGKITARLEEFKRIGETGSDEDLFAELVFCLLTPQSKAKSCWAAVQSLQKKNLLKKCLDCRCQIISSELNGVRFHNNKARYIQEARKVFMEGKKLQVRLRLSSLGDAISAREWLVVNILGMGYKEAGHFLRNIGMGKNIAILDRHILKNLKLLGVIDSLPHPLSKKKYLEIEQKMKEFSKKSGIPLDHLDLLLWYKETGEVYK